jgi:hypothetical protein
MWFAGDRQVREQYNSMRASIVDLIMLGIGLAISELQMQT